MLSMWDDTVRKANVSPKANSRPEFVPNWAYGWRTMSLIITEVTRICR